MTKTFGLCPGCKARIKINNIERLDGKSISCPTCGNAIRIRAPRQPVRRVESEEAEVMDEDADPADEGGHSQSADDEFASASDDDREIPVYQPRIRRTRSKSASSTAAKGDGVGKATFIENQGAKTTGVGKRPKGLLITLLATVGALTIVGLFAGGFFLMRGFALGTKFESPKKYVTFAPKDLALSAQVPEGWAQKFGGGQSSIPISARFTSGSISIDVRESVGGGALGQAAISMQQSADAQIPREAPVIAIHGYHKARVGEDFNSYNEEIGSRAIVTKGYGEGRISDFAATEGLMGGSIKGCRATVMNSIHQFTITCKCPPAQFKDVRPVFEKVIASLNTGGG